LRVVDIAGLVRGASHGEGLGNQFLSHIRGVDAIAMVVRCFEAEDVPHVTPYLDPVEDVDTVELELILSDLDLLQRRLERMRTQAKGNPHAYEAEIAALEMTVVGLQSGAPARRLPLDDAQRALLGDVDLLTIKPMIYVANVGEGTLPEGGALAARLRQRAGGDEVIALSAQLESELLALEPAEAREYLATVGLDAPGLQRFIWAGYRLLDYITFFTTTGGKEVRAWNLRRGETVLVAAGRVHTDLARGFIRAEVVTYADLMAAESFAHARDVGHLRIEGRDYVVQDGDVIHIRFNV
ncbi:MAG: redox-regulated ATPase YchF, partial [Chloroflexota bacterium]